MTSFTILQDERVTNFECALAEDEEFSNYTRRGQQISNVPQERVASFKITRGEGDELQMCLRRG